MARGDLDPRVILDGELQGPSRTQDNDNDNEHDHDHDHHDHAHVAMASLVVHRPGPWERAALEDRLRGLLASEPVIRLKGRLRQADRPLLLQIQAVGTRLECWYEGKAPEEVAGTPSPVGLELVVLGAAADQERLERAFASL